MGKPNYDENREYENLVNEIRVEQGYTLKELASLVGISGSHMWFISAGLSGPYHGRSGKLKEWASKLQTVFGYDLSEIFPREVCTLQTSNLTNYQLTNIAQGYEGDYYTDVETKVDRCERAAIVMGGIHKCLTEREKKVLELRFYRNKTLQEIGDIIGLSRDRIRQLEARSLRILRGYVAKFRNESMEYMSHYNDRMAELRKKRHNDVYVKI